MIVDKLVKTGISSTLVEYYENLGYTIPKWTSKTNKKQTVKKGTIIYVSSLDLKPTSNTYVEVICDHCGKIYQTKRKNILHSEQYCKGCGKFGREKTMLKKYGVNNSMYVDEFKNKIKDTNLIKYGVDNPMKNSEIKDKTQKTCMEIYGVKNPNQNIEVIEKRKNTCLEKYGYTMPLNNKDIKQKAKNTILKKYNVEYCSQSSIIKEKVKNTVKKKYGVDSVLQLESVRKHIKPNSSCQQEYICNLYNGILNYPFNKYYFDILIDDNIDIEIDFGGHDLCVKTGNISEEEFYKKQMIRDIVSRRNGFNVVRIVSRKDYIPSKEKLLTMLKHIRMYFNEYKNHTWMTFDLDNSILYCAECKSGVYYDFGDLFICNKKWLMKEGLA